MDPVFFLAAAIVANSALSLFYYLRLSLVMFFEESEKPSRLKSAPSLRMAIMACALLTVMCGIGPVSEWLVGLVTTSIDSLLG